MMTVSGQTPETPVVSKKSGHVYEKRLIIKYIDAEGKVRGSLKCLYKLVSRSHLFGFCVVCFCRKWRTPGEYQGGRGRDMGGGASL